MLVAILFLIANPSGEDWFDDGMYLSNGKNGTNL